LGFDVFPITELRFHESYWEDHDFTSFSQRRMEGVSLMEWLQEAIKNYNNLSESEQAHVDAACDAMSDVQEEGVCICGTKNCPDEYSHITHGY